MAGTVDTPVARSRFYVIMGLVGVAAASIGFFGTYTRPVLAGAFSGPSFLHWHGAFAMGWVLLFAVQPWFIRRNVFRLHRVFGVLGVLLAVGAAATMLPAQYVASTRDAADGGGDVARALVLGALSSGTQFLLLVFAGALHVHRPPVHKRLMLLATIVLLWPAWFRWRHFLPWVPNPDLWLGVVVADSLIVVAWLRDRLTQGRIHPVLLWVGLALMLMHLAELSLIGHPQWVAAGLRLYDALTPIVSALPGMPAR
jgi:hypothetical protein